MSQLQAFNMDLVSQVKALEALLLQSAMIHTVLVRAERLPLPHGRFLREPGESPWGEATSLTSSRGVECR